MEIEKTILSVLNQTYKNVEYIIVDGASKDGTVDIIKKYEDRIAKWISEPDKGIYDAMNKGIQVASGEWIHFLNAGDIYHDNMVLETFVPQIEPTTQIAYGDAMYVFESVSKRRKALPIEMMKKRMPFTHPSTLVNLSYHKEHLFDLSFKLASDYNFFFRSYFHFGAKFQYINVAVADFEALSGASVTNPFKIILEDARIRGDFGRPKWYLCFAYFYVTYYLTKLKDSFYSENERKERELKRKIQSIE